MVVSNHNMCQRFAPCRPSSAREVERSNLAVEAVERAYFLIVPSEGSAAMSKSNDLLSSAV